MPFNAVKGEPLNYHKKPTNEEHGSILTNFDEVSFSLDSFNNLVQDVPNSDPKHILYSGACTCEGSDHSERT